VIADDEHFLACGVAALDSPPIDMRFRPTELPDRYVEKLEAHQARGGAALEAIYGARVPPILGT
jgi:hypothetical protein